MLKRSLGSSVQMKCHCDPVQQMDRVIWGAHSAVLHDDCSYPLICLTSAALPLLSRNQILKHFHNNIISIQSLTLFNY